MSQLRMALLLHALAIPGNASAQICPASPVAVPILGSGGPATNPDRAVHQLPAVSRPQATLLSL